MQHVEALLFDLGGVVIHIDFDRALGAWQRHSPHTLARLRELYLRDEPFRRHETGALADEHYFEHLRATLGLGCDTAAVRDGWNTLLVEGIEPTLTLIDSVKDCVPCYALSNTNGAHLQHMQREFAAVLARFRRVFCSHEIGHRKPQPEAFRRVVDAIGVPAGRVLFFDDLQENVDAAVAFGLQGAVVTGPHDVRAALERCGLVA